MTDHLQRATMVVKLKLELQCKRQVYVLIMTLSYLLNELKQSKTQKRRQSLITQTKK